MESKLIIDMLKMVNLGLQLLIEPVWNRNRNQRLLASGNGCLLIEPVWNRNRNQRLLASGNGCLLIEPVWNRNIELMTPDQAKKRLLIEPVWNRNLCIRICKLPDSYATFNRTRMESKRSFRYPVLINVCTFNRTRMESKRSKPVPTLPAA